MTILEKQVDALMRLCCAAEEKDRLEAREEIRFLMQGRRHRAEEEDPEYWIRQILLELGAPDHLLGHSYVVQGILLVIHDRMYINNITFGLYPQLAARFDTTASRVERAIRHLIEVTWSRGDWEVLDRYFGSTVDPDKGKPTNGEFIARIANVVKQRLRMAA
ncbi:MAG: sporulation initiation factor Spo0A C-terminal domain-containing protein [Oscillospiraceae bacterium]|nr:sporulation initiation factor Spo0A C-terminal domain-containing protein [Oscillospiraceae bacterium]MBR3949498.1 sporulation initiation factor Spo0A C-terminal domain-containing protein [Oscillospiraceae bacterium]